MTTTEESTLCRLAREVAAEPRFCTENFGHEKTVVTLRNQLQRSSSKETLCAREVHRMVLGGLNVQILHQKMLFKSYMF